MTTSAPDLQMLGLKLMLLAVTCEDHGYPTKVWRKIPSYINSILKLDFKIENAHKTCEYLSNKLFASYSTVVIMINCYHFPCRAKNLLKIIKAIECNRSLRYQLKVICTFYQKHPDSYKDHDADFSYIQHAMYRDYCRFWSSQLENSFLFQDCHLRSADLLMKNLFKIVKYRPHITAQELELVITDFCALMTQAKGNVELYFYSVNPALAIIINNYYFTNHMAKYGSREGSEKDVLELIRQFKISRTPYILLQDCDKAQLLTLVEYFGHKDLKDLECLMMLTMTHGTQNNIIYTNDGQLNFNEDILGPIQSNNTLTKTHIVFVNNYCRGELYAPDMDSDESDQIQPTQSQLLRPNTSIIFSVPDKVISPRYLKTGAPFMNNFCKSFGELESPSNVKILYENIKNNLKCDPYYAALDVFEKSPELVIGDATEGPCIKPIPAKATEKLAFFESIKSELCYMFPELKINVTRSASFCVYAASAKENNSLQNSDLHEDTYFVNDNNVELNEACILPFNRDDERNFEMFERSAKGVLGTQITTERKARTPKHYPYTYVLKRYKKTATRSVSLYSDWHLFGSDYGEGGSLDVKVFQERMSSLFTDCRYNPKRARLMSKDECFVTGSDIEERRRLNNQNRKRIVSLKDLNFGTIQKLEKLLKKK